MTQEKGRGQYFFSFFFFNIDQPTGTIVLKMMTESMFLLTENGRSHLCNVFDLLSPRVALLIWVVRCSVPLWRILWQEESYKRLIAILCTSAESAVLRSGDMNSRLDATAHRCFNPCLAWFLGRNVFLERRFHWPHVTLDPHVSRGLSPEHPYPRPLFFAVKEGRNLIVLVRSETFLWSAASLGECDYNVIKTEHWAPVMKVWGLERMLLPWL